MARSKRGKMTLPALTGANNTIPVQSSRVSKESEKQRIATKSSAVSQESSAIRKENAEIEAERLAIEELKRFNPQDPQIPIRQKQMKRRCALVGERGRDLGLRKAALKAVKEKHAQQIEEVAERRIYAKAVRELQEDLQSQQYTPAPAQSGNGYGQAQPQNQTLGITDFRNAQQEPQMQSAAPDQSGYGYFQQQQIEAARQQLEENTCGKQQMQMESDTNEVLHPDRLPARYGTGAYIGMGFSSPELTRDHSTILTQEMLRERDARRQALRKIIDTPLVPFLRFGGVEENEQQANSAMRASNINAKEAVQQQDRLMSGTIDLTGEGLSTSEAKHQAQPGDSTMAAIGLNEDNPSAPQWNPWEDLL